MTSVFDETVMALSEVGATHVAAAVKAAGPNRVGDPVVGALGFLSDEGRLLLVRAARLAHRHHGHRDFFADQPDDQEAADFIQAHGSWRRAGHGSTVLAWAAFVVSLRAAGLTEEADVEETCFMIWCERGAQAAA